LRAEGFSCTFDVLEGGLGIRKLQFFIKKIKIKKFSSSFPFLVIKILDPDSLEVLDQDLMNPDPITAFLFSS
jgi:hypothetical protein